MHILYISNVIAGFIFESFPIYYREITNICMRKHTIEITKLLIKNMKHSRSVNIFLSVCKNYIYIYMCVSLYFHIILCIRYGSSFVHFLKEKTDAWKFQEKRLENSKSCYSCVRNMPLLIRTTYITIGQGIPRVVFAYVLSFVSNFKIFAIHNRNI